MPEDLPKKLQQIVDDFQWINTRQERTEMLMYYADQFEEVPEAIATRPFAEEHHVTYCESDAYVWALLQEDGTMKFEYAVENPQGLSAMAMSAILKDTIDGLKPEEIADISCEIVYDIFGSDVSMGKGQGLMGIVKKVQNYARAEVNKRNGAQ